MKHLLATLTISLGLSCVAEAQTATRDALARRLASVMGIVEQLEAAKRDSLRVANVEFQNFREQAGMLDIPADAKEEALGFSEEYTRRMVESWDSEVAASIYVAALTEELTEKEIEGAIAFYSSEQGQKANKAIQSALGKLSLYIQEKSQEASKRESKIALEKVLAWRERINKSTGASK